MISQSYATATEADDYLENQVGNDEWPQLTDDEKDKYLITATRQIERLKHKYPKVSATQTLKFPVNTGDSDDTGLDQAKEANIIQALYLAVNADTIQEARANKIQGVTEESIGPMGKSTTGLNPMALFDPQVITIMTPYIDLTVRQSR